MKYPKGGPHKGRMHITTYEAKGKLRLGIQISYTQGLAIAAGDEEAIEALIGLVESKVTKLERGETTK